MQSISLPDKLSLNGSTDCRLKHIFENRIMQYFNLTVIASVEPGQPWTQQKLDQLEGDFQKRLMCMDYNGGMNTRDGNLRTRKRGS